MKIMPFFNLQETTQKKCSSNKISRDNISFQAFDPTTLIIYKIIKMGAEGIREINSNSKKVSLLKRIRSDAEGFFGFNHKTELASCVRSIQTISRLPDNFYSKRGSFDDYVPFVCDIRDNFTENISKIPDNNICLIHTKIDFINSLFNNGHEATINLVKLFQQLDDKYYGLLKQEIIDKCFFSPLFNSIRDNPNPNCNTHILLFQKGSPTNSRGFLRTPNGYSQLMFDTSSSWKRNKIGHAFCNLELLSTLDKDRHSPYIKARTPIINKNKECLQYSNADWDKIELYNKYIEPLLNL